MKDPWPFDQPPNCAVVTVREVAYDSAPVLLVSHNADDHGWQFLCNGRPVPAHAVLVALSTILDKDPSLYAVADLPPGWVASRKDASAQWVREKLT